MYILRKIATECKKCKFRDICDHKRFVACAMARQPRFQDELTSGITVSAAAPVLRKRDIRTINLTASDQITIDLEDIKKELHKSLSCSFMNRR